MRLPKKRDFAKMTGDDLRAHWYGDDKVAATAKLLSEAYNTSADRIEEPALRSDWQQLIETATVRFPDHLAARYNITPTQRLTAIANVLGWPANKIAEASGASVRTVFRWLANENVLAFRKAFEYHTGSKDAKELIDQEQFHSLQILKDLRDDPRVSASTRKEIAQWFYEQKHGKAKEVREVQGTNIRELTEALMNHKLGEPYEKPVQLENVDEPTTKIPD